MNPKLGSDLKNKLHFGGSSKSYLEYLETAGPNKSKLWNPIAVPVLGPANGPRFGGRLRVTWSAGGRSFFSHKMKHPCLHATSVFAACLLSLKTTDRQRRVSERCRYSVLPSAPGTHMCSFASGRRLPLFLFPETNTPMSRQH